MEWATPECLGPVEAARFSQAQDLALVAALPAAETELLANGYEGRLFLLKNNADRAGNVYGCHESYDVRDPAPFSLLHSLVISFLFATGFGLVFLTALTLLLLSLPVLLLATILGWLPGGASLAGSLRERLWRVLEYLFEVGPAWGSGVLQHAFLWLLRLEAALFSPSAARVLFRGHLPALIPFLVTRQVFAGTGHLSPEGEFLLGVRPKAIRRLVGAFVFGPSRPLVDVKEFFYRRPWGYRNARKRLHHLAGEANRSEYAELLKLATTAAVLDAIEAGALDGLRRDLVLLGGPLAAFRAVAEDPTLRRPIARSRQSGETLTALDVQRRYLEGTWEHYRQRGGRLEPEVKDALVRWGFVLDALSEDPGRLDAELDWVIKRKLMESTLREVYPELEPAAAWTELTRWGRVNALLETSPARDLELEPGLDASEVEGRLREVLPPRQGRALARLLARGELAWEDLPLARETWLRLKTIDLRYHEISSRGGYYDWWSKAKRVTRVLDPLAVTQAQHDPPDRTRAAIRGRFVQRYGDARGTLQAGWSRLVLRELGREQRTIRLEDPYQFLIGEGETS